MATRPRVVEYASDIDMVTAEAEVETAALPVGRFAVEGATAGKVTVAGQGVRPLGVSMESIMGRAAAYTGDFQDYAVGDTAKLCYKTERYVVIEAETGSEAPQLDDKLVVSANGKVEIGVAVSGDVVVGTHPEPTVFDGVTYLRFLPTWQANEVL